jgi:hypothetical protein
VTEDKSVIDFPMDGAPSEGCSTTTNLAQLSIESDAGVGAVHIITLTSGPQESRPLRPQFMRSQLSHRSKSYALRSGTVDASDGGSNAIAR